MNYSPELKDALLRRMLPPNNESITKISREEGISEQTLCNWRDKARKEGYAAPGTDAVPDDWSTQDKFLVVVETASMNETELAEYARKKGLYIEQIKAWKDACMNANGGIAKEASRLNRELKDSEKERRKLEKELQRKGYVCFHQSGLDRIAQTDVYKRQYNGLQIVHHRHRLVLPTVTMDEPGPEGPFFLLAGPSGHHALQNTT